jgi:hypothetical protein
LDSSLLASDQFLTQTPGPKEQTGSLQEFTISISTGLNLVRVKTAGAKGFSCEEALDRTSSNAIDREIPGCDGCVWKTISL